MKLSTSANYLIIVCLNTKTWNGGQRETGESFSQKCREHTFKWGNFQLHFIKVLIKHKKSKKITKMKKCTTWGMEDTLLSPKNGRYPCPKVSFHGDCVDSRITIAVTVMQCSLKWFRMKRRLWKKWSLRDTCQSMSSLRSELRSINTNLSQSRVLKTSNAN